MQLLQQINKKLDLGWKMTNVSCPNCQGTTLAEPKLQIQQIYCPKEDKFYPIPEPQSSEQQEQVSKQQTKQDEEQQFYEEVYQQYKNEKQKESSTLSLGHSFKDYNNDTQLFEKDYLITLSKTNQISKKIGQKLVQGWTMLNQSCPTCLAPLMKSKKGERICFGCNRDFNKPFITQNPKVAIETKQTKKIIVQQCKLTKTAEFQIQKSQQHTKPQVSQQGSLQVRANILPSHNNQIILNRIEQHSLLFLQRLLMKATNQNDLAQVQRLLQLVFKIKNQFK